MSMRILVPVLVLCGLGDTANAGLIAPGAFTGNEVVTDFNGLGLPSPSSGTLVLDGNEFSTASGPFFYGGPANIGRSDEAIFSFTDTDVFTVNLGVAMLKVGGYASGLSGNWTVRAQFFGESSSLLGTTDVSGTDRPAAFFGWEADSGGDLIKKVVLTDLTSNSFRTALDDFTFEAIPEPSSFALLGMGVVGLIGYRKRSRTTVDTSRQPRGRASPSHRHNIRSRTSTKNAA